MLRSDWVVCYSWQGVRAEELLKQDDEEAPEEVLPPSLVPVLSPSLIL